MCILQMSRAVGPLRLSASIARCALLLLASLCCNLALAEAGFGGIIEGSIEADVFGGYGPGIPGITVYAINTATLQATVRTVTDAKGAFVLPNQPAGNYQLCWNTYPGLTAGCDSNRMIEVINKVSARYATGRPDPDPAMAGLTGRILHEGVPALDSNGSPTIGVGVCARFDPFMDIDETATVELRNGAGSTLVKVRTNADGYFTTGAVPPPDGGPYTLRVSCGTLAVVEVPATLGLAATRTNQDITLPANAAPAITQMSASLVGQTAALAGVAPGTQVRVRVTATDADGDALHYRWRSTAGVSGTSDLPAVLWTLPATGKGLHFLYVDVTDRKGGHATRRVALSTDAGTVAAGAPGASVPKPADNFSESEHFLTYRGLDTRRSACRYYLTLKAVAGCTANGFPIEPTLTFDQWLARNNIGGPAGPAQTGEMQASFRNVADLNLIRNHHAKRTDASRIAYYVCNHAKASGAVPDTNLVACVAMEYSIVPGANGGRPFVQFYTFGPTGQLYLSVNLDGRSEKFIPGTCVVCHGGDGYFHHFPELGTTARDANIGTYMMPFDLDNFEFDTAPGKSRAAQENMVRRMNLLIKQTSPTPVARQLIDGWYPGGVGNQFADYLPPGWNEALDSTLPAVSRGAPFNASELYLKMVKPSCRLCHVTMGTRLGLDFNRYTQLVQRDADGLPVVDPNTGFNVGINDPGTAPDDRVGDFEEGHSDEVFGTQQQNQSGQYNSYHTYNSACDTIGDGPPTWNIFDNTNEPGKTMPNAIQTFNRFWQDPVQLDLMQKFLNYRGHADASDCDPTTRPPWAAQP